MCAHFERIWPFVVITTSVSIHVDYYSSSCKTQNSAHSVPYITLTNLIRSKPPLRSPAWAPEKQIIPLANIIQTDLFSFQLSCRQQVFTSRGKKT